MSEEQSISNEQAVGSPSRGATNEVAELVILLNVVTGGLGGLYLSTQSIAVTAEEFETWLHQLNEAFVASTTASLDVEEALIIVKRRVAATTDLTHDGGPDLVLKAAAHRGTEQPLDPIPPPTGGDHDALGAATSAADLLLRADDGDPVAWEEIVRRYSPLVRSTVAPFRLQEADAENAVQSTWLRLAERIDMDTIRNPELLGGWLATTARRECLHILRRAARTSDPIDTVADTVPDPSVGPEQHCIEVDSARTLRKLVAKLSPRQRTLLRELFTDNPRSYAEIARVAGIPPGAIGPTRQRALRQLRLLMETHGRDVVHPDGTCHDHVNQDDSYESPVVAALPALVGLEVTVDDDELRRQQRLLAYALATA